jgi:hypothetical protein
MAALEPDQSQVPKPAGDGWQMLGSGAGGGSVPVAPAAPATATLAMESDPKQSLSVATPVSAPVARGVANGPVAAALATGAAPVSLAVQPIALPGSAPGAPSGVLSFTIAPQDSNLRNALDRELQSLGMQLAWRIDDDLPLEFSATFSGDLPSVLTQVMQATDHMRTPARICWHINDVIRVIARAANCKESTTLP